MREAGTSDFLRRSNPFDIFTFTFILISLFKTIFHPLDMKTMQVGLTIMSDKLKSETRTPILIL